MLLIQSMRKLRKDLLAMNLTASVCILVVASLCCYGWPVKQYLCNDTFLKPRHTSAWLTPLENAQAVICTEYELPSRLRGWNLSYHQGGNGPWIPKVDGVVNEGSTLPAGCDIDQVHVLARHAERYPTADAGQRHLDLVYRLKNNSKPVHKSLAFVKHWNYFRSPGSPEFESLIRSGRYAGTTAAERTGELLRSRYGHLVNPHITMRFWSASSPRDIETAEHFALGFFGSGWNVSHISTLEIIPESPDRGANTLTPGKTCLLYQDDFIDGRHSGYRALDVWQRTFAESIKTRLAPAAPGFNFSAVDIYSMFEMCGFEIMVRGVSPWCNVFTNNDWLDFEYGRDLLHFYRAGPGNKYAGAMGMLWLNAMLRNMRNESESAKSVYAAFVHDGDIIPVVAALGLLDEPVDAVSGKKGLLPSQHRRWDRNWRTSDVVPMGGRLVFERIKCHGRLAPAGNRTFVRLLINDGHMALTLGGSDELLEHDMALGDFEGFLDMKREELGDFRHVCGIDEGGPGGIDFLHQ